MSIIKCVNGKNTGLSKLESIICYCMDSKKTRRGFIYGLGVRTDCTDMVFEDIIRTKKLANKLKGRQYMHFIYSPDPTAQLQPDVVHKMGKEIAFVLARENQVLLTTHVDKIHYHCHIIVNSVSSITGLKLSFSPSDLYGLKQFASEISKKYGVYYVDKTPLTIDEVEDDNYLIPEWADDDFIDSDDSFYFEKERNKYDQMQYELEMQSKSGNFGFIISEKKEQLIVPFSKYFSRFIGNPNGK